MLGSRQAKVGSRRGSSASRLREQHFGLPMLQVCCMFIWFLCVTQNKCNGEVAFFLPLWDLEVVRDKKQVGCNNNAGTQGGKVYRCCSFHFICR